MSAAEKVKMKENQATENLMTSLEKSLETPTERKKRMISLYIVHLSMLVVSLGSSIIFTGVYPYLLSVSIQGERIPPVCKNVNERKYPKPQCFLNN